MKNNNTKFLLILGSSRKNGEDILKKAILELARCFYIVRQTDIIKTKAFGVDYTDYFFNQAIIIESQLSIHWIMKKLQKIEKSLGQKRKTQFWGERVIDIDIIFASDITYYDTNINLPHESIYSRDYVVDLIKKIGWENEKF